MLQASGSAQTWSEAPLSLASVVPAPLGVGMLFTPSLRRMIQRRLPVLDFVSIVPESLWADTDPVSIERTTSIGAAVRALDAIAAELPLVAHGTGRMMGGRGPLDHRHLSRLAEWHARYGFRWYSDHLSFAPHGGLKSGASACLPVPYDRQALKQSIDRVREVQEFLPLHFLLENNACMAGVPPQEMSEPMFLNRLCAATGCGLLLDVHTLCANAVSCGIDPLSYLDRVDLSRVVEVHVSSESPMLPACDYLAASLCPPTVLEVLEAAMWRAPGLRAVTIEVHASGAEGVDEDEIERAIDATRRIWTLYH